MDKNLIQNLVSLGFKEYEAKVFIVLTIGGEMGATEIAKKANVQRSNIYDILKTFVEKGYCNEVETSTINKYHMVEPLSILDKIEREYNLQNKRRIELLTETFTEINKNFTENKKRATEEKDSVELVRGFNKQRFVKYIELIKSAKHEILVMTRIKGLVSSDIDSVTEKFIKSGGVVRSIYCFNIDLKVMKNGEQVSANNDDLLRICRNFEKTGEQVRLTKIEIPNMVIIDKQKVYVNITGDSKINKNKQADLIVNDESFTANMIHLFNYYWNDSQGIESLK